MLRFIKACLLFAQHQPWVNEPEWKAEDAKVLELYLKSDSGVKLLDILRNTNLRQQEKSLAGGKNMKFEAGYCTGQRAAIAFIQGLSLPPQLTEDGEHDADQPTN